VTGTPAQVQYAETVIMQKINESVNGFVPAEINVPYVRHSLCRTAGRGAQRGFARSRPWTGREDARGPAAYSGYYGGASGATSAYGGSGTGSATAAYGGGSNSYYGYQDPVAAAAAMAAAAAAAAAAASASAGTDAGAQGQQQQGATAGADAASYYASAYYNPYPGYQYNYTTQQWEAVPTTGAASEGGASDSGGDAAGGAGAPAASS
jgi:hypothetical protein